ncbi:MAG: hypothetical protein MRK01_13885 [Candidatus Scalindua sp.]|nr:hypothetical protein [Candidatus Scalindua sp.]
MDVSYCYSTTRIPKENKSHPWHKIKAESLTIVKNHAVIEPLPEKPIEIFCGIFKDGTSLLLPGHYYDKEGRIKSMKKKYLLNSFFLLAYLKVEKLVNVEWL